MQARTGAPNVRDPLRRLVVVGGLAGVGQREQAEHLHLALEQLLEAGDHRVLAPALEEVADEDEDRLLGLVDQPLAVGDRLRRVVPAAELRAEEDVDRVVEAFRDVEHLGRPEHQARPDRVQRREHGRHDGRVDDRGPHRAALVDADDDVPLAQLALVRPEVEALGREALALRGRSASGSAGSSASSRRSGRPGAPSAGCG